MVETLSFGTLTLVTFIEVELNDLCGITEAFSHNTVFLQDGRDGSIIVVGDTCREIVVVFFLSKKKDEEGTGAVLVLLPRETRADRVTDDNVVAVLDDGRWDTTGGGGKGPRGE